MAALEIVRNIPSQEEVERREMLFNQILETEYVKSEPLPPYVTIIPANVHGALAVRDSPDHEMTQVLYGIVKAGSHGFGIATAYGSGIDEVGQSYVTHIKEDPYTRSNRLVSPLFPDVTIILGGKSKLVPAVSTEGHHFEIRTDERGKVRLQSRQHKLGLLTLITATHFCREQGTDLNPLENEVGTWSVPPDYLRRALRYSRREI